MAERTVNVTINYKVNTAEVQRAQTASQAAQRATDQLRNSANRYGAESAKAFKQSGDAARLAHREVSSLDSQFNSLYNSVRLFLTAGLLKETLDVTLAMAKLSGTVEGVERAFKRLPNSTLLLSDLRRATRGTVNDLELMQKALMASNFRIPLEKLGTLLEFAAVKAQQTGQNVEHMVNFIVSGIGYRQIKRLDDLGFTLNRMNEALGGVSLQAATMGQVMDAVSRLMQEDLEKTGGFAETSATKVDQLTRAWHDLRVAFSQKFESSPLLQTLTRTLEGATDIIKAFPVDKFKDIFQLSSVVGIVAMRRILDLHAHWLGNMNDMMKLREIEKRATEEAERVQKRLADFTETEQIPLLDAEIKKKQDAIRENYMEERSLSMVGEQYSERAELLRLNRQEMESTVEILQEYRESLEDTNDVDEKTLGIIQKKREEIEQLREQIEETTRMGDLGASGELVTALAKAEDELAELLGKKKQKADNRQRENDRRSFEHWKYYDDLRRRKLKEAEEEEFRLREDMAAKQRELEEKEAERRKNLQREMYDLTEQLVRSTVDLFTTSNRDETENIRKKYDEQIALAGDNERAKDELRIKQERELEAAREREKELEKRAATARISIDGLIAIGKIFAQFGWPAGIAPAAIMAGITATNIATVRKYAKGVLNLQGPGTETSDSIPAMLSKGESVMTAEETRSSFGLLKMVKANKIDDRILKQIDFSGGRTVHASLNDERIVSELKSIRKSQYKLEEQAGIIYRVYTDDDGNKRRIRGKSI